MGTNHAKPDCTLALKVRGAIFIVLLTAFLLSSFARHALAVGDKTQLVGSLAANRRAPIPMNQLGAVAGKQYEGDGLSVSAVPRSGSARLRCVFQRLEGEATAEGLWLS
jgi:hypothetical protein